MDELEDRHSIEENWHDDQIQLTKTTSDFYSIGVLNKADAYAWALLGNISGKIVIDFGCGEGYSTLRLAEQGATVYAFDISLAMIETTYNKVLKRNLQNRVSVDKMAAEKLTYRDGFADLVFGHSILHHTDLSSTRQEISRILKPGGRAVFLEPLAHNQFVNLFRWLTPSRRTSTEKPLKFEDVLFFAEPFAQLTHREFYLTALSAFVFLPLRSRRLFQTISNALVQVDELLLNNWPKLGKYA